MAPGNKMVLFTGSGRHGLGAYSRRTRKTYAAMPAKRTARIARMGAT
jgi:hypothetical protein